MRMIFLFILILLVLMTSSFQKKPPVTQSELIEQYIDEMLSESEERFWKSCRDGILEDAVNYVDSILYQVGKLSPQDTIQSPGKPVKPNRPFDTLELDTTPVKRPWNEEQEF